MDPAAGAVIDAVAAGDWPSVRLLLHPYLHWTRADGTTLRGRIRVLALLEQSGTPDPPSSVELRNGQVYRWHEPGG